MFGNTMDIEFVISSEVKRSVNVGNNLDFTKELILAKCNLDELPRYMSLLVEEQYIKCLFSYWLAEAPEEVVSHVCNNNILQFIKELDSSKTFIDCNKLLNTGYYYRTNVKCTSLFTYSHLLNELHKTSDILKSKEPMHVAEFKFHCKKLLLNKCEAIQNEQYFFGLLINLLESSKSPNTFCQYIGLSNLVVFENASNFKKFLHNLTEIETSNEDLKKVQQAARNIINENDFFLIKDIKEIINSYLDINFITEKNVDGRIVLEVSGKHIVVSKVKVEIEAMLNDEIEEVRFINTTVIHIDADLCAEIWCGKNIIVYAEKAIVSDDKNIVWDVSGKDAQMSVDTFEAITVEENGCGRPGAAGRNGESGGNVLIMVYVLENGQNFTVKSCGGNGSSGHDGEKGKDGADGAYLDKKSFKENFPPVSKFRNNEKVKNLEKTKSYVVDNFKQLDECFVGYSNLGNSLSKDDFESIWKIADLKNIYFKVQTGDGRKITFSFYNEGWTYVCQSFLLHEGSIGSEGRLGGAGGKQGTGGNAGEIKILLADSSHSNVILLRNDGKEGLSGKPGPSGKPGKAGLDIAYKDYAVNTIINMWPKWVIPGDNENKKLKVSFQEKNTSETVYCPHNNLYADIKFRENDCRKVHKFRSDKKQNNELHDNCKTHVQSKKTICEKSIKQQYPLKLSSFEILNLSNLIDEAKINLSNLNDEISESEHITSELRVSRQTMYFAQNKDILNNLNLDYNITKESNDHFQRLCAVELIACVKRDPLELNNWNSMLETQLNISQLQGLWETISSCEQLLTGEYNKQFKIRFCNKYQLAVLKTLTNTVDMIRQHNTHTFKNNPTDIPVNIFDKIFTMSNEDDIPSRVEQFLVRDSLEDRQDILKEFQRMLESDNDKLILYEIVMLFLSECSSPVALKMLEKVNSHRESHYCLLSTVLHAFKSAIFRDKNSIIFKELYKGIVENSKLSMAAFENKVQDDMLLSTLYDCYVKKHKQQYGWECLSRSLDSNEIKRYLLDYGTSSACYRELLAYYFDTNILIYSLSETNQITLLSNHNPRAEISMYFFSKENKLVRLNVNNGMIELYNSQKIQGTLLNNILVYIDHFTEKEQFDSFSSNCQTLSGLIKYGTIDKSSKIHSRIINVLMEENNIRQILKANHLQDQTTMELSCRLDKLRHEYTGCEMILHILALHFDNEGKHISSKEFIYVINFVLKCALTVSHVVPLLSWVLATQNQKQWLPEIILLNIELNLKKPLGKDTKAMWKEYLSKQTGKTVLMLLMDKISEDNFNVTEEQFEETIFLLGNVYEAHVGLEELDFTDWKYYLKSKFWAYQLVEVANWPKDVLNAASYYMLVLENLVGFDLCKEVVKVLKEHKLELEIETTMSNVPNILCVLANKEVCLDEDLLKCFKNSNVIDWMEVIEEKCYSKGQERDVDTLVKLISNSGNTSDGVKKNLGTIVENFKQCNRVIKEMKVCITQYSTLEKWVPVLLDQRNEVNMSSFKSKFKKLITNSTTDNTFKDLVKELKNIYYGNDSINPTSKLYSLDCINENRLFETLFATVVRTVEINSRPTIKLRDTQKLAIMIMFKSEKNILNQISTGEGKTFVIVIFAIISFLMKKKKVDIITSSRVLAERDAKDNRNIYNMFGINVGHNCYENIEERKKSYSDNKIVYGELANFQRDFLLHDVYKKNILGDRSFDTVTIVVDEVDSMLLDKCNNTLYLSHEIPGLDKLEPVFIFIWKFLHIPSESNHLDLIVSLLRSRIMFDIFGTVSKENFKYLDTSLGNEIVENTWDFLVREGFIDNSGKVLKQPTEDQFSKLPKNCISQNHLKYIFKKVNEREKSINVPNYLKQFVEEHLDEWIKNAVRAMTMEPGVDYVVDIDRSDYSCDRSPNIMIIDRDTGNDLTNSEWENGLHQFLQLKHGCRLSLISLKAVFISNVNYLKKYKHLYGLTGTLGSEVERKLLIDTYDVDFVTIPTANTKLFTEEPPIVCSSRLDWNKKICEEVSNKIKEQRSVLIVCETVNDVMSLKEIMCKSLSNHIVKNIHTYTRDYEELIIANKLEPGHIIISTNLAGRGTDIKLSDKLVNAGGLHVCLTYLPRNSRIEEQALGRAARNGQRGSGRLIFQNFQENALTIINLKQQRDINEVLRIREIEHFYKSRIEIEENCFQEFSKAYKSITKSSDPEIIESILLQVSLDQWAFWLERNYKCLSIESVKNFTTKIRTLDIKKIDGWRHIIEDPFNLTKLGLALAEQKRYDKAIELFDHIIEKEPLFSEGAQYYKLYVKSKLTKLNKKVVREDLNIVKKQLMDQINTSSLAAYTIDCLKKKNPSKLQIESFKEQQLNVAKIHSVFLQEIHNIVGQEIEYEDFILPTIMDEETAFIVFNDLVRSGVISERKIKNNISEKEVSFALNYGILPKDLILFLKNYEGEGNMEQEGKENKDRKFEEKKLLDKLKEKLLVPSRELFWSVLVSKHILINEKTFCIVDINKLGYIDPSSVNIINQLNETYVQQGNEIWLYQANEIVPTENNNLVHIQSKLLKDALGEFKYVKLLNKSIIYENKLATLQEVTDNVHFDQFCSIKKDDFAKLGISLNIAAKILGELVEQHIIEKKENTGEYLLLVYGNDLVNVELSKFKGYSNDVIQLLKVCFSFKIALENLYISKAEQMENGKILYIPLPAHIYSNIVNDLFKFEIVTKHIVNPEVDISKILNELYPKYMPKDEYVKLFNHFYDENTAKDIVDDLISSDWLVSDYLSFRKTYSITLSNNNKPLPAKMDCYTQTIKLVLNRQLNLVKGNKERDIKGHIEEIINRHSSVLHTVESPTFSLQLLSNKLKKIDYSLPTSEYRLFSLNGFENILILEEKKYTIKMVISASSIALLGLAEIGFGVALSLLPAGAPLVSEGIGDIIYSIYSFYSGHFSWRDYIRNKAISLILSACFFLKPVEFFKSTFGSALSSPSPSFFSSVKSKCSSLVTKTKSFFSSVFKRSVSTAADSSVIIQSLTKQVALQTTVACGIGLTFVAVDNFLEPQLEMLGKELMERALGDINEIEDRHNIINLLKEIYILLDENRAKTIILRCFSDVLDEYKTKNMNDWVVLSHRLMTIVNKDCLIELQQLSKKGFSVENSAPLIFMLITIITKLNTCIKNSQHMLPKSIILKLMNSLELKLNYKLNELRTTEVRNTVLDSVVNTFISKMLDIFKSNIKTVLSQNIHLSIVNPLLSNIKTMSGKYLINLGPNRLNYNEEGLKSLIELNEKKYKSSEFYQDEELKTSSRVTNCYSIDYNECLSELFERKRSIPIYLEILKNSSTVNKSFIELCCSVIPLILREEGLNVPMLRIVVKQNGRQHIYGGNIGSDKNVLTITLSPQEAFLNNLKQNKILLRNVLDTTYKTIIKQCPEYKGLTSDLIHKFIINAVENNFYVQEIIKNGSTSTTNFESIRYKNKNVNINKTGEKQNLTEDENNLQSYNNLNLKDDNKEWAKTTSQSQVDKIRVIHMFNNALAKINHHLQLTQPHLKYLKLTLEDFVEVKHVIISDNRPESYFDSYATEYELIVPLMEPDSKLLYDYNITMSLKAQRNTQKLCPFGLWIEYAIHPVNIYECTYLNNSLKGRIMLDFDCQSVQHVYSTHQCHSAGELALEGQSLRTKIIVKDNDKKKNRKKKKLKMKQNTHKI